MPEELAIALVVLVAAGWIIYKVVEGIIHVANQTRAQVRQTLGDRRDRKYQQKRAIVATHLHIKLPNELEWATKILAETTAAFEAQRKASKWIPERPTWPRSEFTSHTFVPQGRAVRQLNIAEISRILSPQQDVLGRTGKGLNPH